MLDHEPGRSLTSEELFRNFMAGDCKSFEKIVEMYEGNLSRFIYGMVEDYHETKHITIEAFANLAVGGGKFEGRSSLKTYLFTIAKNLAVQYLKTRRKEQHISFEELETTIISPEETADDLLEKKENRAKLHEAMQKLKDEHRIVLTLLYFEDMSYKEAGQTMKKTETQIKHLAYRAKASLKDKLEKRGLVRN